MVYPAAASPPPCERLGIVGLGLIGGSVAAAFSAAWPGVRVLGVDRPEVSDEARRRGWVHEARPSPADLVDADLVVLATPVPAIRSCLHTLARAGCLGLVTDVGSTKRSIMRAAETCGLGRFVGGHPMAGAETSGLAGARADLFAGRPWCVVAGEAAQEDVARVEALAAGVGARPVRTEADAHDRVMAYVSHLPQIVAVALMNAVGRAVGEEGLAMAGRGLIDMTRLASSSPGLWDGILADNADYVAEALDALGKEAAALDRRQPDARPLAASFDRAGELRKALTRETS